MTTDTTKFKEYFDLFMIGAPKDASRISKDLKSVMLPVIPQKDIIDICSEALKIFKTEPVMLTINSPIMIIGDIHGHILDLFRNFSQFGLPPNRRYLFLGDLVDRGEFSLETVLIVFLMKIIWPSQVYLIRGNHEFFYLCSQGGFSAQIEEVYYGKELVEIFMTVFSYLPFSALIDNKMLCVHGGIGPGITSLTQLGTIKRPITDFGDDLIDSLLWSDPSNEVSFFEQSNRGTGYLFGEEALKEFLKSCNLTHLIRGHECVLDGYEPSFNGTLYTIFGASNYCGLLPNCSAVLDITSPGNFTLKRFPPLSYLKREDVIFTHVCPTRAVRNKMRKSMPFSQSVRSLPIVSPDEPLLPKLSQNNIKAQPSLSNFKPSALKKVSSFSKFPM